MKVLIKIIFPNILNLVGKRPHVHEYKIQIDLWLWVTLLQIHSLNSIEDFYQMKHISHPLLLVSKEEEKVLKNNFHPIILPLKCLCCKHKE